MGTKTIDFSESGDTVASMLASIKKTAAPPYIVVGELEALVQAAFVETQAATHVITGSLKASGKTDTDFDGDVWSGQITYGGELWKTPAPGPPNNPVVYAIYEMARGGEHDFFGPLVAYEGRVEEILMKHFDG